MDKLTDLYAPLIGRILMGGFFLWNGVEGLINFPATLQIFAAPGLAEPMLWAGASIAIEIIGGAMLIAGWRTRVGALVLALYTLGTSFLFLTFSNTAEIHLFVENMAVVGGLLYLSAYGPERWRLNK